MGDQDSIDTTIRPATPDDVPHVAQLIKPFVAQRKLLARNQRELKKLAKHGFVAVSGERIVGFAAIEIYSRKMAEIQCLAVAEDFQGKGIGRRLVQCCIDRAKEQKVYELMAITSSDDLFKSCGFDYALPNEKRALFVHTGELPDID